MIVQPFAFLYVIVTTPPVIPVTNPRLDIVAIEVFDEVQGFVKSGAAVPVNCEGTPRHMLKGPEIVGLGKTLRIVVIVQPFEFLYVIVTTPTAIPVTNPRLDIVAIEEFDEVQAFVKAGDADPVN